MPIMTIDRISPPSRCKDYIGLIGSDFVEQGKRAADAMIKATGGTGKVAILLGASGNNVTTDRDQRLQGRRSPQGARASRSSLEQTGDFARDEGPEGHRAAASSPTPTSTASTPRTTRWRLGAITALKAASKKPGDVKIVSIDGTKGAVQGIVDGWIYAVIESNPRFGPLAFDTLTEVLQRRRRSRRTSSSPTRSTTRPTPGDELAQRLLTDVRDRAHR